jgi:M6 family metalloprotease-like protein
MSATRRLSGLLCLMSAVALASAAERSDPPSAPPVKTPTVEAELSDYRTVDTAETTTVGRETPKPPTAAEERLPGYLGVNLDSDPATGKPVVAAVADGSAAAKAGLKVGDRIFAAAGTHPATPAAFGEAVRGLKAGDRLELVLLRGDKFVEAAAVLEPHSRPLKMQAVRAVMGVRVAEGMGGVRIEQITPNLPADKAGLKVGDVIAKIDGAAVGSPDQLIAVMSDKRPGDTVSVAVKRDGKDQDFKLRLAADQPGLDLRGLLPRPDRMLKIFKKDTYRLAVICIEFPDVKHNAKVAGKDWEKALFSKGEYLTKSPTGQDVYGSMNDYYLEQSCGKLSVSGKVFDWVEAKRKRAEYGTDANRFALLTEALDKVLARDGKDALKGFDGIFFLYAGPRQQSQRGGLYWPHRAMLLYKLQRWDYFICPEGGSRMESISVIAHEFGHMLGMPDLYAPPETPGAEGLGVWCTMSTGHGRDGKPLHFSAWCKEQLGWLKPAVIDPAVKQKLILSPIEDSDKECFKVLVRPDGSEYLLLENRRRRGFDRDLPAEGLLIWRVVDGKPVLEESHGIGGAPGPQVFLGSVPYPSGSNTAFTPDTTPSSKPVKPGGAAVHITNIRRLPDGRITFHVGYKYD